MARCQEERSDRRRPVPVAQWSPALMDLLQQHLPELLQLDLAQSTRRSYDVHVRQYREICTRFGRPFVPAAATLARFVLGRAVSGYKLSYIELGVSAVSRWGMEQGVPGLSADPLVIRALKAAGRLANRSLRQKLPLSHQQLITLLDVLPNVSADPFIAARDAAMFIVGWVGMFRCSELVAIQWQHIHFCSNGGVMVFVPQSKTDPGEGAWVFLAAGAANRFPFCPVRALRALRIRTGGTGYVFTARQNRADQPLSKTTVGVRLHKALEAAGVADWKLYGAHSLRRGGATHAARLGLSLRMIQAMGRWKSDAVRMYLYVSPQQMFQAANALLQAS